MRTPSMTLLGLLLGAVVSAEEPATPAEPDRALPEPKTTRQSDETPERERWVPVSKYYRKIWRPTGRCQSHEDK